MLDISSFLLHWNVYSQCLCTAGFKSPLDRDRPPNGSLKPDFRWAQTNFALAADECANSLLVLSSAHTSFCTANSNIQLQERGEKCISARRGEVCFLFSCRDFSFCISQSALQGLTALQVRVTHPSFSGKISSGMHLALMRKMFLTEMCEINKMQWQVWQIF